MCPFIPESPYYYILKGDEEQALKSLKRLRKGHAKKDVERELELIKVSFDIIISSIEVQLGVNYWRDGHRNAERRLGQLV